MLYIAPTPPRAISYPLSSPNFPSFISTAFSLSPALIYAILILEYAPNLLFGTFVPSLYIGTRLSAFTITYYSLGSSYLYSIYLTKPISSSIFLYFLSFLFFYISYTCLVSVLSSNFGGVSGAVAPFLLFSSPSGLPPFTSPSIPIPSFLVPSLIDTRCVCWLVTRRPSSLVAIAIFFLSLTASRYSNIAQK